jgi:putative polyhydroxyalkanoate system protein
VADISLKRVHTLAPEDVRMRVEGVAEKVASRLGGSWEWQGEAAVCKARGARARIAYDDTTIEIEIDLPRLLRPVRGKLEGKVEEYFERYFGSA